MLSLLSDENIPRPLIQGMRNYARAQGITLDLVTAAEVGIDRTPDPLVLEWAAVNQRVVLTLDKKTMIGYAYDRVRAGQPMPGMLVLRKGLNNKVWIENLVLAAVCRMPDELTDQVHYVPETND